MNKRLLEQDEGILTDAAFEDLPPSDSRRRGSLVKRSIKQEKACAKVLGGKRVVGSGNRWYAKGDVVANGTLTECKFTSNKQYALKEADLKEITAKGILEHRLGVMLVEFVNGTKWAVVPWDVWIEVVNESWGGNK